MVKVKTPKGFINTVRLFNLIKGLIFMILYGLYTSESNLYQNPSTEEYEFRNFITMVYATVFFTLFIFEFFNLYLITKSNHHGLKLYSILYLIHSGVFLSIFVYNIIYALMSGGFEYFFSILFYTLISYFMIIFYWISYMFFIIHENKDVLISTLVD